MQIIEHRASGVVNAGVRQGFINRAAKSKNSASAGGNSGRAPKYLCVHPDDNPGTNDPQRWMDAAVRVQANTRSIKSKTTGRFTFAGNSSVPSDTVR